MSEEIDFEIRRRAGVVTLNRPDALNALTHRMVVLMHEALTAWADHPQVERVLVRAAGGRAFCSGGDIRTIYEMGKAGDPRRIDFFADEYRLNALIKRYPKPYVALIDGICMGGGVGISVHGSHRVASENIVFAMPETGIGFFPDVGASFFLPRMPGTTGLYCALTAARLGLADAHRADLVTHPVPSDRFDEVLERACEAADLDAALAELAIDPGHTPLGEDRPRIDRFFTAREFGEILANLDSAGPLDEDWAAGVAKSIRAKSPTSCEIVFHELKRGASLAFPDCMKLEFRIVSRVLEGHDFYEGVRALIVDKDRTPRWDPPSLDHLDIVDVEAHFQPPEGGDLDLDAPLAGVPS